MKEVNKLIGILIIVLTLISCEFKTIANFKITNNCSTEIDSLVIYPNENADEKYISLKPRETVEYKVDMTNIGRVDGDYLISYKINNQSISQEFGYYSNGYPLEELIIIEIEEDSIIFDFGY